MVRILKITEILLVFLQDLVFHVKAVDLAAFHQRLSFEPLTNQNAVPETFDLLFLCQPGVFIHGHKASIWINKLLPEIDI